MLTHNASQIEIKLKKKHGVNWKSLEASEKTPDSKDSAKATAAKGTGQFFSDSILELHLTEPSGICW